MLLFLTFRYWYCQFFQLEILKYLCIGNARKLFNVLNFDLNESVLTCQTDAHFFLHNHYPSLNLMTKSQRKVIIHLRKLHITSMSHFLTRSFHYLSLCNLNFTFPSYTIVPLNLINILKMLKSIFPTRHSVSLMSYVRLLGYIFINVLTFHS